MKFAIYVRKSKFTGSGESIKNQISMCRDFIKFKFSDVSDIDQIIKNINYFRENFSNLEIDEKKSLLRLIIDKITWNNDELKIILNGEQ